VTSAAPRWADWIEARWGRPLRSEPVLLAIAVAAAGFAVWQPLLSAFFAGALLLVGIAWTRPQWLLYGFVLFMGNVKVNYYAGFFTVFPEYVLVLAYGVAWFLRWAESPRALPEPGLQLRFAAWMLAGVLSLVFAPMAGKVLAHLVLMALVATITLITIDSVRSRAILRRALAVFEVTATLYAIYGIAQMIGMIAGFDLNPRFLEKYANPDMYLGIGAPLRLRLGNVFRANSFFNDPNIFAGYLATAMCLMFALRAHHAAQGRRLRAGAEAIALAIMALCMVLTMSRSGLLAMGVGTAIVMRQFPDLLRRPAFWLSLGVLVAVTAIASFAVQIDPAILFQRLGASFDTGDLSNRTHRDVFFYGLQLLARHPLTGVGLGNFGRFYGTEIDAYSPNMMTHCAPMTYFAESGLAGGCAFLALIGWVAWRAWSVVRDRALRARDPELHAFATALLAAVVAMDVANLFYDYYLRTFVWVISGLAVTLPYWRRSEGEEPAQ
jgi:O-antigen ligase